ncbi:DUF362 domain-containing protein [Candidatus Epulonipiscium viviparus]|uniref:DUF362 domain-containing protein n=1 Tax=Candidatus Epulonipiscium viviparus TaxID=420336 RepID=UPI00273807BE|nr:DUF362 domain-containing protein [Candidatus Epulopiscium viviparus]
MDNKIATVALVQSKEDKAEDITDEQIKQLVQETVELAGGLGFIKDGQTVVVKPNIISTRAITGQAASMRMALPYADAYKDKSKLIPKEVNGITADYRVAQELTAMVREVNPTGKIYIMESSGDGATSKNLELMGYIKENFPNVDEIISLDDTGNAYRNVDAPDVVGVDPPANQEYKKLAKWMKNKYYFDKKYYESDVVISLCCLKNHMNAGFTGGIKNIGIGVMPQQIYRSFKNGSVVRGLTISHEFNDISHFIHDYYSLKPADFVLLDGLQGLAYGPAAQGAPSYAAAKMNMRVMMASKDVVANDTIAALIVGVDPHKVPYIKSLAKDGVGVTNLRKIVVKGNVRVDQIKKPFPFAKGVLSKVFRIPAGVAYDNYNPPKAKVKFINIADGKLNAKLEVGEEVIKVEIYNEQSGLVGVVSKDFSEISVDFEGNKGVLIVYDNLLNAQKIEF